jgi:hypothetical protein
MSKRVKNLLFWGSGLAMIIVLDERKISIGWISWLLIWFSWVALVDIAAWLLNRKGKKADEPAATQSDPRFDTAGKAFALLFNYHVSNLLFYLNPLLVTQSLLQLAGRLWEKTRGHPVLDATQYQQKVNYVLPVTGEWFVSNGGITEETSHSWSIPSQRFAYDLVKQGPKGLSFAGDGRRLEDYFCFDAPILAPADGAVVAARDGIRDAPHVGTFWMDWLSRNIAGNSVLIQHAEEEYCLLAHLKRGSVRVKAGQVVKQGQEIGRCGHSGNSSEPHLHSQFQNGKSLYFSSGLPVKFSGFARKNDGEMQLVEADYISKKTTIVAGEEVVKGFTRLGVAD